MTVLSVNVNKIALLRNSRGRNHPNLVAFVEQLLALGVKGITVHPRPDERHISRQDVYDISHYLNDFPEVEFNIEGYPVAAFLDLVIEVGPAQCTLVPDQPGQLTSDHGWDVAANQDLLVDVLNRLREAGIRSSLFVDPSPLVVTQVRTVGADRVELYTEDYASRRCRSAGRPADQGPAGTPGKRRAGAVRPAGSRATGDHGAGRGRVCRGQPRAGL